MKLFAGVKYLFIPERVHRLILCLRTEDGALEYEAVQGSGAFIHIVNEKLRGFDVESVREKAVLDVGAVQPIQSIELNEDDLSRLTKYRVPWPQTA
jgi:hypothetical protein